MIEQFCRFPASRRWAGFQTLFAMACAAVVVALGVSRPAAAQITTKMLIGDSVSEVGNQYADVDQAIKYFMNGDAVGTRQFLENAKKKDASLPPVDLLMAKLYNLTNNGQATRAFLERAASESPNDPEAYLILADQALQQGRMIEADALYERASSMIAKFDGNAKRKRAFDIRARIGRVALEQQRKNWEAAAADLKALLQLDPDNVIAHYQLGRSLFMQKQFKDGFEEFNTAKKGDKDKTQPDPFVSAAIMYDQLKMADKAQQAFDRALTNNKTDPATLTSYANWLIRSGSPDALAKAEALLTEGRKANPGNLNLLLLSGVNARMLKKAKAAEDFLVEAHGIAPGNSEVINQLAQVLAEQADQAKRERAMQFAGMSAQMNNQNPDAMMTYAWVLLMNGRTGDAGQAVKNALQLGTLSPDGKFLLSKMIADKNPDAVKQILKEALDSDAAGIFVYRKDAQGLMDSLGSGSSGSGASTPPTPPSSPSK